MIKGIPGRSYGLSIARRLQLPEDVLERAESRLSTGERDVAALLGDLQAREAKLAEREERSSSMHRARRRDSSASRSAISRCARPSARSSAERAKRRGGCCSRGARRSSARCASCASRAPRRPHAMRAGAWRSSRPRMRRRSSASTARIVRARRVPAATGGAMAVGDTVEMETLDGRTGQIVELRDDQAIVAVGALKMTVPVSTLSTVSRAAERAAARTETYAALPDVDVSTEIDVRGMRVDEMELAVQRALDAAIGADLHVMRIIHGKGTGALRERVDELLRADRRVREHCAGRMERGRHGRHDRGAHLMITDESVERVREGADIVQIISEHVKLKRVGNSYPRTVSVSSGHRARTSPWCRRRSCTTASCVTSPATCSRICRSGSGWISPMRSGMSRIARAS